MLFSGGKAPTKTPKEERKEKKNERDEKYELQENVFLRWAATVVPDPPKEYKDLLEPIHAANILQAVTGKSLSLSGTRYDDFITVLNELGDVKLTQVELADGQHKAILSLWWALIQVFWKNTAPEPIQNDKVQEALRGWCSEVCREYPEVSVSDFTSSWRDGHAFNVLLHNFDRKLVSLKEISNMNALERLDCAFNVAEKQLGVPRILHAKELHSEYLDSRSVVVYLMVLYLTLLGKSSLASALPTHKPAPPTQQLAAPPPYPLQEFPIQPKPFVEQPQTPKKSADPAASIGFVPITPTKSIMVQHPTTSQQPPEDQPGDADTQTQSALSTSDSKKQFAARARQQHSLDNPMMEVDSVRSRKSSSSSQKSGRSRKARREELAREFDQCLEQVLAWLLEAEEEIGILSDVETDDVATVKTQFRDYEQFMASLTESQDTVGRVLHRGQMLCQKTETEVEREAIQKQLQLVNSRWEELRALAMGRQTQLQTQLTTLQQKQLTQICNWLSDTETFISAAPPLASSAPECLKQIDEHTRLQKRIDEFQGTIGQLSSFVAVVDEEDGGGGDLSVTQLEHTLRSVGERWESICQWAELRTTQLDGLAELIEQTEGVFENINDWLKQKEHELLGLKSAHHLDNPEEVAEQVRKLQKAESSLESEHGSVVKISQLSCELVGRLDTTNGPAANEIRRRLDTLTQRWDNLVTRIEEHSHTLVRSGKADLKQLREHERTTREESPEKKKKKTADESSVPITESTVSQEDAGGGQTTETEENGSEIIDRFLLHIRKLEVEMQPLHQWCDNFSLSRKPTEVRKMIAVCQQKLLEIKEQEAKVNRLQLELERIHMNKEVNSTQLRSANDAFESFAKGWAKIVTKISEALNVLSGHAEDTEEGGVARGIEEWIEGCDRVLGDMHRLNKSDREVRAQKLRDQLETQRKNLGFIEKDHLKKAILTKGLEIISKRIDQQLSPEKETLSPQTTSSVMRTSSVPPPSSLDSLMAEIERELDGEWAKVGDTEKLERDLERCQAIMDKTKGVSLPLPLVERAETRRAEMKERLESTQTAAEKCTVAEATIGRLSSSLQSTSNSSNGDLSSVLSSLQSLRNELTLAVTETKEAEKSVEKMINIDGASDEEIRSTWRARVSLIGSNWNNLSTQLDETLSCVKLEQKKTVQQAIYEGDKVLESLSKTLEESEKAVDAEELSEHLDQLESLLEQVPESEHIEEVVNALDESSVRNNWERHSSSKQKLSNRAKERIVELNKQVNDCEKFDKMAKDLEEWAGPFSAVLAQRKNGDICALDIPEEYQHLFEGGQLVSKMQKEFDDHGQSIEEMRKFVEGTSQNERLKEQLEHAEKTYGEVSTKFAEFKQPVRFEERLERCTQTLADIENTLDDLTGINADKINDGLLESKDIVKQLIEMDSELKDLENGREKLTKDGMLGKPESSQVKEKIHFAKKKTKELGQRAEGCVDRLEDAVVVMERLKNDCTQTDTVLSTIESRLDEYGRDESTVDEGQIGQLINEWNRNESLVRSLEELERVLRSNAVNIDERVWSGERRRRADELKIRLDGWNSTVKEMNDDEETLLLEVDELHENLLNKLGEVEREKDPKEIASSLRFLRNDRDRLSSRARRLCTINPRLCDKDLVGDVNSRWSALESRLDSIPCPPPSLPEPMKEEGFVEAVDELEKSFQTATQHMDFEKYPVTNVQQWRERVQAAESWMCSQRDSLSTVLNQGRQLANNGRMELETHKAIDKLDDVIDMSNELESDIERNRGESDVAVEKLDSLGRDIRVMVDVIESLSQRNLKDPEIAQATQRDLSERDSQLCSLSRRAAELHTTLPGRSSASRDSTLDQLNAMLRKLETELAGTARMRAASGKDPKALSPDRTSMSSMGNSLAMEVHGTDTGTTEDESFSKVISPVITATVPTTVHTSQEDVQMEEEEEEKRKSMDIPIVFEDFPTKTNVVEETSATPVPTSDQFPGKPTEEKMVQDTPILCDSDDEPATLSTKPGTSSTVPMEIGMEPESPESTPMEMEIGDTKMVVYPIEEKEDPLLDKPQQLQTVPPSPDSVKRVLKGLAETGTKKQREDGGSPEKECSSGTSASIYDNNFTDSTPPSDIPMDTEDETVEDSSTTTPLVQKRVIGTQKSLDSSKETKEKKKPEPILIPVMRSDAIRPSNRDDVELNVIHYEDNLIPVEETSFEAGTSVSVPVSSPTKSARFSIEDSTIRDTIREVVNEMIKRVEMAEKISDQVGKFYTTPPESLDRDGERVHEMEMEKTLTEERAHQLEREKTLTAEDDSSATTSSNTGGTVVNVPVTIAQEDPQPRVDTPVQEPQTPTTVAGPEGNVHSEPEEKGEEPAAENKKELEKAAQQKKGKKEDDEEGKKKQLEQEKQAKKEIRKDGEETATPTMEIAQEPKHSSEGKTSVTPIPVPPPQTTEDEKSIEQSDALTETVVSPKMIPLQENAHKEQKIPDSSNETNEKKPFETSSPKESPSSKEETPLYGPGSLPEAQDQETAILSDEGSPPKAFKEEERRSQTPVKAEKKTLQQVESVPKEKKEDVPDMNDVFTTLDNIEDAVAFEEEFPLENLDDSEERYKSWLSQLSDASRAVDANAMTLDMLQAECTQERVQTLQRDVNERRKKSVEEKGEWREFEKSLTEAECLFAEGQKLMGEIENQRETTDQKRKVEELEEVSTKCESSVCSVARQTAGILPRLREGGLRGERIRQRVNNLEAGFSQWIRKTRCILEASHFDPSEVIHALEAIDFWCDETESEMDGKVNWTDMDGIEVLKEKLTHRLSELNTHRTSLSTIETAKDRFILLNPNIDQQQKHDMRRNVSNVAKRLANLRSDLSDRIRSLDEMKVKGNDIWNEVEKLTENAKEIERRVNATHEAVIYTPSKEHITAVKKDATDLLNRAKIVEKEVSMVEKGTPKIGEKEKNRIHAAIALCRNAATAADSLVLRDSSSAMESSEVSLSTVIEVSEKDSIGTRPDSAVSADGTVAASDRVESVHDEVHTSEESADDETLDQSVSRISHPESGKREETQNERKYSRRDQSALNALSQMGHWLTEIERDAGLTVDLANVQQVKDMLTSIQSLIDQLRQRTQDPIGISDAAPSLIVKQKAMHMTSECQRILAACQKRKCQLNKMAEQMKNFDQLKNSCELWMVQAEGQLGDRPAKESNEDAIRMELVKVEELVGQLDEQKERMKQFNAKGNSLLDEFPRDDAHSLSHLLSKINMKWSQFNDNIRIRRAVLEASLRSRHDFHSALFEIEEWLSRMSDRTSRLDKRTNNTQSMKDTEKRRQRMEDEKGIRHEIEAHSEVLKTVEEMGKKILGGLEPGKEKQEMDGRLQDLDMRWKAITSLDRTIRERLEDAEQEWEKLTNSLAGLLNWADTKSKQLLDQQPVGGSLSAALAQGAFVKNVEREIETKNPSVKETIANAHSYLMQHDLRPKMYKPGVLEEDEGLTEKDMDERRYGLQIHADCEKLKEKWVELGEQTNDWGKVVTSAVHKLQELERALAECQLHLSAVEQDLESARAVENLRLEELKGAREEMETLTGRVDHLRVHLDDANDACGKILAADLPLDTHPRNQLDAVNQRFHAVKTSVRVRAAALRNAISDFGPSSEHFLNNSVTLPWQRAISKTNALPYYIDHNTECTQWEHPVWVEMAKELNSFNRVKFIAYRTAMKLRALQKRLCLDLVSLPMLEKAFDRLDGLSNEECPGLEGMVCSLLPLFEDLHSQHPQLVQSVALAVDLCINFLLNLYDPSRDGILRVLSFKVALISFCNAPLEDKYRALFNLVAQDGQADQKHVALLFYDLIHIPKLVGEAAAFGGSNVEPTVRSCFEMVKLATHIQCGAFMEWLKKEPQSIVWLPVMHRLATAEFSKHQAKCNVCKMFPLVGLRYRCLNCFNFDMCQNCFFSQRTSKNHKLKHPMQEYSIPTTSGEDVRDFAFMVRNKFGRRKKSIGYLPVEVGEEGLPVTMAPPAAHNPHTSAVHSRIGACAERLAQLTQSEPTEAREEMTVSDLKSPLQLISQVDQMQKDELDQLLSRLQVENSELKRELEKRRQAAASTPDLDRSGLGYSGTMPRIRDGTRSGTMPRLGTQAPQHGRSVPSLHTTRSTTDVMDEARALRLHKQRLEHRSRILEQQNSQLEMQLQRLKKMIDQRDSTSRIPSMSAEREWTIERAQRDRVLSGAQNGNGFTSPQPHHGVLAPVMGQDWEGESDAEVAETNASRANRMHSLLATVDDLGRAMESLVVSVVCDSDEN